MGQDIWFTISVIEFPFELELLLSAAMPQKPEYYFKVITSMLNKILCILQILSSSHNGNNV